MVEHQLLLHGLGKDELGLPGGRKHHSSRVAQLAALPALQTGMM